MPPDRKLLSDDRKDDDPLSPLLSDVANNRAVAVVVVVDGTANDFVAGALL